MSLHTMGKYKCPKCDRIWSFRGVPNTTIKKPIIGGQEPVYFDGDYEVQICPQCEKKQPIRWEIKTPYGIGNRFRTTF